MPIGQTTGSNPPHFPNVSDTNSRNIVSLATLAGAPLSANVDRPGEAPAALLPPLGAARLMQAMTSSQRSPTLSDSAVGREIRELRRSQGRTQKDLARVVGVTGAQLHRYETGATRIAASRLIAIANALGIRPDVLIAAGSVREPSAPPVHAGSGDDIVELIQVFGSIGDPKHRAALVAVARMMAAHYNREGHPTPSE